MNIRWTLYEHWPVTTDIDGNNDYDDSQGGQGGGQLAPEHALVRLGSSTEASTNVSTDDSTDELQQIFKSWE